MYADDIQPFAEQLRVHRDEQGLTNEKLASKAQISIQALTNLLSGKTDAPREDTVQRLITALRLDQPGREIDRSRFESAARRSRHKIAAIWPPTGSRPDGMLPEAPATFISRAEEMHEFRSALQSLLTPHGSVPLEQSRRVMMFRGEGGWGKTTLLGQCASVCDEQRGRLFRIYVDWEKTSAETRRSTAAMMGEIARLFEAEYHGEVEFTRFRATSDLVARAKGRALALRNQFGGKSREEFDSALRNILPPNEYDLYDRPQLALSAAFVHDLVHTAQQRPVVIMFDTWEVVSPIADEWLRNGLLHFALTDAAARGSVLFVFAGRFPPDEARRYWDAVRRLTHERGLYERELAKFTPLDVAQYFAHHPSVHLQLPEDMAERVCAVTLGIPLAVQTLGDLLSRMRGNGTERAVLDDLEQALQADPAATILQVLASRFLSHLERQPEPDTRRDLSCIFSVALMRYGELSTDSVRRLTLLKELWIRLGIVGNAQGFWSRIEGLRTQYSFWLDGAHMHADVYAAIRGTLRDSDSSVQICEQAARLCKDHLDRRAELIEAAAGVTLASGAADEASGRQAAKGAPYHDREWQEWFLDWINFRMWCENGEDVVRDIANYYVRAMQHGTPHFHLRLMSLIRDDMVLFNRLSSDHRKLVTRLLRLEEWSSDAGMEAELRAILAELGRPEAIGFLLAAAGNAAQKGDFGYAAKKLGEARALYQGADGAARDPLLTGRMGAAYHEVGRRMAKSARTAPERLEALGLLERAVDYMPDNPYLRLSLAEVLVDLGRLDEAMIEISRAKSFRLSGGQSDKRVVTEPLLLRIAQKRQAARYSPAEHAKAVTERAKVLSAQGAFQEAERLYEDALSSTPLYPPAVIRLSHLLRHLGRYRDARNRLESIGFDELTNIAWRSAGWDAWGALLLATQNIPEAIAAYSKSTTIAPDYLNPWYGLGRAHLRAGQAPQAVNAFKEALRVKEESSSSWRPIKVFPFWVWNGIAMTSLLSDSTDEALHQFSEAERLTATHLDYLSRRYHMWAHRALAIFGQEGPRGIHEKTMEALAKLERFEQLKSAKGFLDELMWDIAFVGEHAHVPRWHMVSAFVERLLW